MILCIETSTNICSVALAREGVVFATLEEHSANSHAALLTVLIEKLMTQGGVGFQDLDAVAVSSGPGSYTGLRIGVSVAKGICFGLQKPLIAITSLQILAAGIFAAHPREAREAGTMICPMIDARRMEVYSMVFDSEMKQKSGIIAEVIESGSYGDYLEKGRVLFAGNGAGKCQPVITHPNAVFLDHMYPLASAMGPLTHQAWILQKFEDVAYFEPFYLKDFVATLPKRKVI
jgi:tRNA threonylcarbamoyladenosine biosynthesis protein TsaB